MLGDVEDPSIRDALLALAGSGKELWADEHADEYVRRLRECWEPTTEDASLPDDPT